MHFVQIVLMLSVARTLSISNKCYYAEYHILLLLWLLC
jgi:hypothetical protein